MTPINLSLTWPSRWLAFIWKPVSVKEMSAVTPPLSHFSNLHRGKYLNKPIRTGLGLLRKVWKQYLERKGGFLVRRGKRCSDRGSFLSSRESKVNTDWRAPSSVQNVHVPQGERRCFFFSWNESYDSPIRQVSQVNKYDHCIYDWTGLLFPHCKCILLALPFAILMQVSVLSTRDKFFKSCLHELLIFFLLLLNHGVHRHPQNQSQQKWIAQSAESTLNVTHGLQEWKGRAYQRFAFNRGRCSRKWCAAAQ